MAEMARFLVGFCVGRGLTCVNVLDVGPGTGHGSNFLGQILATDFFGVRGTVSVVDINPDFLDYIAGFHPYVHEVLHGDCGELPEASFDIVVCSHVIEHVENPVGFLDSLRKVSRHGVICCAPLREPPGDLSPGHLWSIDVPWLYLNGALQVEEVESLGWGFLTCPRQKMFLAVFPPGPVSQR